MTDQLEDLTISYWEDGVEKVKELDKIILSKGAWTTILFQFQNFNATKKQYDPPAYGIRRYQKRNGQYQLKGKFNISSNDQARRLIDALSNWITEVAVS